MTDPIPTMSETGTTWTRAKFLAEIADLPQLAKYVPPYGPMPGVPIADVVAMLREAREKLAAAMIECSLATGHGDTLDDLLMEMKAQVIERQVRAWLPIESAPKDGTRIIVLTKGDSITDGDGNTFKREPCPYLVVWNPSGSAWVDADGCFSGKTDHLEVTGTWDTWDGWLQPDEVTHWQPLPAAPNAS